MHVLHKHHIVDLFVWVEDNLPNELTYLGSRQQTELNLSSNGQKAGGRPACLSVSETITILLFSSLTAPQKLLKGIWKWAITNHSDDFRLPCYSKFIEHCHKAIPHLMYLLEKTLDANVAVVLVDSTMLPVCKLVRADRHKVARAVASFGKNHQGWHYGFKLHAAVGSSGRLSAIYFTPANFYDAQALPKLVNGKTKIAVGDGTYNASIMRRQIWQKFGCFILAPPHPKQNKKVANKWQIALLKIRPKIECVFDYLKEHLNMVTSFPRSINGYLLNYLRNLLAYQIMVGV